MRGAFGKPLGTVARVNKRIQIKMRDESLATFIPKLTEDMQQNNLSILLKIQQNTWVLESFNFFNYSNIIDFKIFSSRILVGIHTHYFC